MNVAVSVGLSVLLLLANAFFVAAEFAVVSAKRHRLEVAAAFGGRSARAAVRNSRELSLGLAGAQLGITLATLGLGALAKPAVADLLDPLLQLTPVAGGHGLGHRHGHRGGGRGVPPHGGRRDGAEVVGDQPPGALGDPARTAVPRVHGVDPMGPSSCSTRSPTPCSRIWKVEPVDEASVVQGPAELRLLLDASREHGLLEAAEEELLTSVLDLAGTPVYAATLPLADVVGVPLDALGRRRRAAVAGERPLAPRGPRRGRRADRPRPRSRRRARPARHHRVADLAYVTTVLDPHASVVEAIGRMRADRAQLALVADTDGEVIGITALEDLLERVLGEFDDETDRPRR